jgi:thymidylate synthase ThyX
MNQACAAYEKIHSTSPDAAAYILPNAFNRRVLLSMNLRSARHLINLRCATNAHFAIRRPTQRMAAIVREKYPLFADFFTSDACETWESIESAYFTSTK